jgi:hypothetical protein
MPEDPMREAKALADAYERGWKAAKAEPTRCSSMRSYAATDLTGARAHEYRSLCRRGPAPVTRPTGPRKGPTMTAAMTAAQRRIALQDAAIVTAIGTAMRTELT